MCFVGDGGGDWVWGLVIGAGGPMCRVWELFVDECVGCAFVVGRDAANK